MSAAGRGVASIGSHLATLALHAEAFGERRSWRAGQGARAAILALHEGVTKAAHAAGLAEFTSEEAEAAWRLPPQGLPPYAAQEPPRTGPPSPLCDALRRGRVPVGASPGPDLPLEALDFREMPGGSPSMLEQFLFYSLDPVEELREAADGTGDDGWLDAALALARQWCRACLHTERVPYVWDDHIAAVRALVFARLWCSLRARHAGEVAPSDRLLLADAMARHARRLALPAFYRGHHNHGVTQAAALLAVGALLKSHPDARAWVDSGVARLRRQALDNVTVAGTHREHSPFYHFYVYRQLAEIARWASRQGITFEESHHARVRAMLHAGAHMLQPDGSLAALGDTHRGSYAVAPDALATEERSHESAWYRWSATAGASGSKPPARIFRDDEGGLLLARSGWGESRPYREERHLSLRLGTAPTSHIHADVLAVTWHGFGADLLVDAGGPFGYGTSTRRDYFLRTRAHNTIGWDDADRPVGQADVEMMVEGDEWLAIDARFDLGAAAEHRRCLLAHHAGFLLLVDRVRAPRPRRWNHRLHLAPTFEARVAGRLVEARDPVNGIGMTIRAVGSIPFQPTLARGGESPPEGWVCAGDLRKEPCATVSYEFHMKEAVIATLLVAGVPTVPAVTFSADESDESPLTHAFEVEWRDERYRVVAPLDGPATLTVSRAAGSADA